MLPVSFVFVDQVLKAGGSKEVVGRPGLLLQSEAYLWQRPKVVACNCRNASLVVVAGLKERVSMSLRQPQYPPLPQVHVEPAKSRRPTQAQRQAVQSQREELEVLEERANDSGEVLVLGKDGLFFPQSTNIGATKAKMVEPVIQAFGNFRMANDRSAFNTLKSGKEVEEFLGTM